jgi:hypothetical protein
MQKFMPMVVITKPGLVWLAYSNPSQTQAVQHRQDNSNIQQHHHHKNERLSLPCCLGIADFVAKELCVLLLLLDCACCSIWPVLAC